MLCRRTDKWVSYPFDRIWPPMAAVSGAFIQSGSIQSLSVKFQFPVPGREGQFTSLLWTHSVVILSFGVVCAIFQFWKINVIFGALCCTAVNWMEGGAEVGCKVIRAEALSCCRERFIELRRGTSPHLFMESLCLMIQTGLTKGQGLMGSYR